MHCPPLKSSKNILKLGIFLLLLAITVLHWSNWNMDGASFEENVKRRSSLITIGSIVPGNHNLFFMDTSCCLNTDFPPYYISGLRINRRQACAMYSTATLNPTRQIILYHSCPLHKNFYERSTVYNKYLLDLPNFYIFQGHVQDLVKGSIIEYLYEDIKNSYFAIDHVAEILSLFMVYKFGGAYMHLDFISQKPISALPKNFIWASSETILSNGVFQFEPQGKGHDFVGKMLQDLVFNYNKLKRATNGPELFRRIFRKFCNVSEDMAIASQISYPCGISVINATLFFPVDHIWLKSILCNSHKYAKITYLLKNTVAIHFRSSLREKEILRTNEYCVYELLARRHCNNFFFN